MGNWLYWKVVFLKFFLSNVIPKTNTTVQHGCLSGVAVEILKKMQKLKKKIENYHLYECVTFIEFGRHYFHLILNLNVGVVVSIHVGVGVLHLPAE